VRNRHRRKYIAVDECQDTDIVQFKLLQLIFDGNIFAVGDENQLIYEWRSAQSGNLTNFSQKFPGAKTLFLGQNYRSTQKLVNFFKQILPVDNGIASHMISENEAGTDPTFQQFRDDREEAAAILAQITDPEETAIIARTNRQLFLYHKICTVRSIKYKILGKKDFWEENEVKKLLQMAKTSNDPGPADRVLERLIQQHNLIDLYKSASKPLEKSPAENLRSVVEMAADKGNIHEFMDFLRKKMHGRKSNRGLILSTVHQMKGREAKNIFFIGVGQGILPHKEGDINEERRIFFVGATRAKERLHISYFGKASEFIQEFINEIEEAL
jgi:DNA helicase-2/ATP-dependent DNA helicase PcrA